MTFRLRTTLRLVFTLIAAVTLTGLALMTVPVSAQDGVWLGGLSVSPDASKIVTVRYPPRTYYGGEIVIIDAATLESEVIYRQEEYGYLFLPLWRWDSLGLMWPQFNEGDGAHLMQYDLAAKTVSEVETQYPWTGDGSEASLAELIWWAPEGYAALLNGVDGSTRILGYGTDGVQVSNTLVGDQGNYPPACQYDQIAIVATPDGLRLAVHYPVGRWNILNPVTGEVVPHPDGRSVNGRGSGAPIFNINRENLTTGFERCADPGEFPPPANHG